MHFQMTRELISAALSEKRIVCRASKTKGPNHTALMVKVCRNRKPLLFVY